MSNNDQLIEQMKDLKKSFEKISMDYQYVEPTINEEKKETTLNHSIAFTISKETLNDISVKINTIRTSIIQ